MVETLVQIQQLKEDANAANATNKKSEKVDKKSKKDVTDEEPQQPESSNDEGVDNANVAQQDFSTFEDTVTISYQPLSVFRVRPVTRCVEVIELSFIALHRILQLCT